MEPRAIPRTKPNVNERQQEAQIARDKARAELAANRADTTTPLVGAVPLETLPDPPAPAESDDLAPQQKTLVISVTILHRGRLITIASEGRSLDAFCDLLDKRFGVAS